MKKLEAQLSARAFKAKAEYWRDVAYRMHQDLPLEAREASWQLALTGEHVVDLGTVGSAAALLDLTLPNPHGKKKERR